MYFQNLGYSKTAAFSKILFQPAAVNFIDITRMPNIIQHSFLCHFSETHVRKWVVQLH